jgi:hypothetical protein
LKQSPLLTHSDAKTIKGEKLGYRTGILYLAPAETSGVMNTCQFATDGCKQSCLYTAGRAAFTPSIPKARIAKTVRLHRDRAAFMAQLRKDIKRLKKQCKRLGMRPAVRLNGTSDLPWIPMSLCAEFPDVMFYDYTKIPRPWQRTRDNYHITFSFSESNENHALDALAHNVNVAVVFHIKRGKPLPEFWHGHRIIDGDTHDLRFLDGYQGVVIGLRAKGKAKKDTSGFVQIAAMVQ